MEEIVFKREKLAKKSKGESIMRTRKILRKICRGNTLRIAIGIMMLSLLMASNAGAATITVNTGGGADYTLIQDAVNASNNGDTIMVATGTYNENVVVNKAVSLIGAGADVTIVRAYDSSKIVFHVTANNVNISGFTVTGATPTGVPNPMTGILLDHVNYANISNNKVSNNYYGISIASVCCAPNANKLVNNNVSDDNYGITIDYSNGNSLINNTANFNHNYGIFIVSSSGNILTNNNVNSNNYGIFLLISSDNILTNNIAKDNNFFDIYTETNYGSECNNVILDNTGSGNRPIKYFNSQTVLQNDIVSELILCNADYSDINNVTIDGSTTKQNNGLLLVRTHYTNIKNMVSTNNLGNYIHNSGNNIIENSTIISNRYGINLQYSASNTLKNNIINSNDAYGIVLSSSNYNILANNSLNSNGFGIYLEYPSNGNMIYNNIFNNTDNTRIFNNNNDNFWNGTIQLNTNIIGGPYLGGNFWAQPDGNGYSQKCTDMDNDGICDLRYVINDQNIDFLPLAIPPHNIDNVPPNITLNGENPIIIYIGSIYTDPGAKATDNIDGPIPVIITGSVDTNTIGTYTITYTATDNAGNSASITRTIKVIYNFAGFFQPVDNLPVLNYVKAGSAIPVKFSLNGGQGLNIFMVGYPASQKISCDSNAPIDNIEETVTAGSSSLSYDANIDQYNYVWKTDKTWIGTCYQLLVLLKDGIYHNASFKFK